MDLEVGIYLVSSKLSSGVEFDLRRRFRLLSSLEKNRDCLEVMRLLVSCSLRGMIPQLMSEFLHKTKETVILHIQADMLGYHGVSPPKIPTRRQSKSDYLARRAHAIRSSRIVSTHHF